VVRKRTRPEHSVLVTHTDVADNDFTVLFQTVEDDPDSYLKKDAATFTSAIGRSFYTQILPSNSVNLGWTSWRSSGSAGFRHRCRTTCWWRTAVTRT